ncbi:MAG: hypothetical protein ABSF90_20910 [Syntrophobacteraceae bacterium]
MAWNFPDFLSKLSIIFLQTITAFRFIVIAIGSNFGGSRVTFFHLIN